MQDDYEKLKTLQEILSRKFQIESELKDIPKMLATKTEVLNRLRKSYVEKNEKYQKAREVTLQLDAKMKETVQRRETYEKQMDEVSIQREYEILDKEIKLAMEQEQQLRREIQKEQTILEEMQQALEREESLIKQQEQELEEENEKVKKETHDKLKKMKVLEKEEKEIIPGLDQEILYKFERIIRNKAGLGIVSITSGVCSGCNIRLPGQFVNEVREGNKIHFCPYCSRILFFEGGLIEDENMVFNDEDAGALSDLPELDEEESEDEEVVEEEE